MEATRTANGKYSYDDIYYGHSIDFWVQKCHQENCTVNRWNYRPLRKGAFGYDNIVVSLVYLFKGLKHNFVYCEHLASLVHDGWKENYLYWRDNLPGKKEGPYYPPAQALGDLRRDECAASRYLDLPEDEKEKDRVLASQVFKLIKAESCQ